MIHHRPAYDDQHLRASPVPAATPTQARSVATYPREDTRRLLDRLEALIWRGDWAVQVVQARWSGRAVCTVTHQADDGFFHGTGTGIMAALEDALLTHDLGAFERFDWGEDALILTSALFDFFQHHPVTEGDVPRVLELRTWGADSGETQQDMQVVVQIGTRLSRYARASGFNLVATLFHAMAKHFGDDLIDHVVMADRAWQASEAQTDAGTPAETDPA